MNYMFLRKRNNEMKIYRYEELLEKLKPDSIDPKTLKVLKQNLVIRLKECWTTFFQAHKRFNFVNKSSFFFSARGSLASETFRSCAISSSYYFLSLQARTITVKITANKNN